MAQSRTRENQGGLPEEVALDCSRTHCDQLAMSAVTTCGSRDLMCLANLSGPQPAPHFFSLLPPPGPSLVLHSHPRGHVLQHSFAF